MMSYGFSDKEHNAGNVGRYGVGFKSGSMRLGQDALVVTKSVEGTATVALLSRTFLDEKQVRVSISQRSVLSYHDTRWCTRSQNVGPEGIHGSRPKRPG